MPRKPASRARRHVDNVDPPTSPRVPEDANLYVNREIALLGFFRRVLEEAQDENNPLLERVKFLSIVGSNLAEFFMVRVAGIRQQIDAGVIEATPDALKPSEQLAAIRPVALQLMNDVRVCLRALLPQLAQAGVHILDYAALDDTQTAHLKKYFDKFVYPVLTPLAYDPGHPFPHISNMSLNLAVILSDEKSKELFARVKVPNTLRRLVPLEQKDFGQKDEVGDGQRHFVWLEQVITANLDSLFPGMRVIEAHPFRITRDADVVIQELEAEDLLETIERSVRERRFGSVVRMTIDPGMPPAIRDLLVENLGLDPKDVYPVAPPLGSSDLLALYELDRPDLKDPPLLPMIPPAFEDTDVDIFSVIRLQDVLLHHPYDSFTPVLDFIQAAARDPNVLAIKQTLYRVGRNSPVVEALLEAARNGKQVAVLIELKARFDEESNIEWARTLEQEGVHVVYGLLGLKTHSKIALVVRREGDDIRRYVHLSTGNYNPATAQVYTDLGLFTSDEAMGADATDVFNYLTGYSTKKDYRKFLVAPINLRSGIEALIRREIAHQRQGTPGHLIFKLNALVDRGVIQLLYEASHAGVKVDLIVRGICCLRPGLEGLSENIRVTSIVGRFLEHSRIYYFRNGGQEEIYLGSADLMPRNLNRRVEILFPVEDARLIRHLRDVVLETYLADNIKARQMLSDGAYRRLQPTPGEARVDSQTLLLNRGGLTG
ncbi:MAG TPA: polyphosphate kinase 1 [Thermodesulfobacteriota bacterium]|nr:polyphosphate kinase 1 [Thermodesulfobacteriota bacterium]